MATEQWLTKQRAVFLLMDQGGQLAGYGWVGASESELVPGGETTFALRIGEAGQGQGLATPYTQAMLTGAAALFGAKQFWLETWASNQGAVHVYHKVGFVDVAQVSGERPTTSGGMVADTRLYMSLPDGLV
jgi:ribosomal protein S18 acetylase RimI-like enzyme